LTLSQLNKERTMVGTRIRFSSEQAPCGRTVDGECYRDNDEDGLVIVDQYYSCGCRAILHEFHDGSTRMRATRHDGRIVADEFTRD
jgi:hypothetical protein